jgi:Mat/Ecp fimbriae major subunit
MKKMIRLATAGAVLAAAASLTTAANAATDNVTASATILTGLNLTETSTLNFASVAVNGAGTVVVGAGAAVDQCLGLVVCAGTKSAAAWTVTGAAGMTILATVQQSTITLTSLASDTMTVDTFSVAYAPSAVLTGGSTSFEVGATLHVAAAQPAGVYSGNFDVDVVYN